MAQQPTDNVMRRYVTWRISSPPQAEEYRGAGDAVFIGRWPSKKKYIYIAVLGLVEWHVTITRSCRVHIADSFSSRKLVIIGDGACGKTSLLSVFTLGYFPTVSLAFLSSTINVCSVLTIKTALCESSFMPPRHTTIIWRPTPTHLATERHTWEIHR